MTVSLLHHEVTSQYLVFFFILKLNFFRDWKSSPIRCMRWHPNVSKLAIASIDENIKIYSADTISIMTLKNGYQKCITSLAWRPLCAGELAVGCNNGIIIWKLDSPGRHTSQFLHLTR